MKPPVLKIKDLAVSDSGFVFDPVSGSVFTVNASGKAVLAALKDGATREDIIRELAAGFDAPAEALERDVEEFIALLRGYRLLERKAEEP